MPNPKICSSDPSAPAKRAVEPYLHPLGTSAAAATGERLPAAASAEASSPRLVDSPAMPSRQKMLLHLLLSSAAAQQQQDGILCLRCVAGESRGWAASGVACSCTCRQHWLDAQGLKALRRCTAVPLQGKPRRDVINCNFRSETRQDCGVWLYMYGERRSCIRAADLHRGRPAPRVIMWASICPLILQAGQAQLSLVSHRHADLPVPHGSAGETAEGYTRSWFWRWRHEDADL